MARREARTGSFVDQAMTFTGEIPARGGVLERSDVLEDVGRAARLDRADKAFDSLASTPCILTAMNEDHAAALVVSTVATASQHPPRISVALRRDHPVYPIILASKFFALNVLGSDQANMVECFSAPAKPGTDPLAGVEYDRGVSSGAPVLRTALAFVECRLNQTIDCGDHLLLVADILDGGSLRDGEPLILKGSYKPTVDISDDLSVGS